LYTKWKRWARRRRFEDGQERKAVISTEQGLRTLSIVSMNHDNFISEEARRNITQTLRRNKIHIAALQETHIPHSLNYISDGYGIITTSSTRQNLDIPQGLTTGEVAILVHKDLEQHITHIAKINNRIMHITLQSQKSHTPITILNTYAPHSGKSKTEQTEHWNQVGEVLKTCQKHIIIRAKMLMGKYEKSNNMNKRHQKS